MDVASYCTRPEVRLAGCILLLLLLLSHGPFVLFQPASMPITVLRVVVVLFMVLLYCVNAYPRTFVNATIAVWRALQPWNHIIDSWTRSALTWFSKYVALSELTKDIVFAYSIAILFNNENKYIYAWAISLLGNHFLTISLSMLIAGGKVRVHRYLLLVLVSAVCLTFSVRHFSFLYTLITLVYHCLIHEWLVNSCIIGVKSFDLDIFEGLEKFYVWIVVYVFQFTLGALHALLLILQVDYHFLTITLFAPVVLLCYIVCYPALSGFVRVCLILHKYLRRLAYFPLAESADKDRMSADVCAVCLCAMIQARRTPCKHYFHGKCLIRCLRHRATCPLCKTTFIIPK